MAYARLGTVQSNLGQSELSEQNRQKAFELRDRASEHEKLYIMSPLLRGLRVNSTRALPALELYKQTYPRDPIPYTNVANIYNQLGQFENGLENARQAVAIDPDSLSGLFKFSGCLRRSQSSGRSQGHIESGFAAKTRLRHSPSFNWRGLAWAQKRCCEFRTGDHTCQSHSRLEK